MNSITFYPENPENYLPGSLPGMFIHLFKHISGVLYFFFIYFLYFL